MYSPYPESELQQRPRHDQISASCEGFVQLWPNKIIGDLCRGRTGTALPGDGSRQSDGREEFLLSTRQISILLGFHAAHGRRCSQEILARMVPRNGSGMAAWVSRRLMEAKGVLIGIWQDRRRLGILRFGGFQ